MRRFVSLHSGVLCIVCIMPITATAESGYYIHIGSDTVIANQFQADFEPMNFGFDRSDRSHGRGWRLGGGYHISDWLSVEAVWADHGRDRVYIGITSGALYNGIVYHFDYRYRSAVIALRAKAAISRGVGVYAWLGGSRSYAVKDLSADVSRYISPPVARCPDENPKCLPDVSGSALFQHAHSVAKARYQPAVGVGLDIPLTVATRLSVGLDYWGRLGDQVATGRARLQTLSVGLTYDF